MVIDMRNGLMDTVEFAKALADGTRQQIMALCCCQQLSVSDIVNALNISQPTVSHHLAVLKRAGLVRSERRGKQVLYTLNREQLVAGCCQVAEDFAPGYPLKLVVQRER